MTALARVPVALAAVLLGAAAHCACAAAPADDPTATAAAAHDDLDPAAIALCEAWLHAHLLGEDPPSDYDDDVRAVRRLEESYVYGGDVQLGAGDATLTRETGTFELAAELATRDAATDTTTCRGRVRASDRDPASGAAWAVEHDVVLDLRGLAPPTATSLSVVPLAVHAPDGERLTRTPLGCIGAPTRTGAPTAVCRFEVAVGGVDNLHLAQQIGFFDPRGRLLDAFVIAPHDYLGDFATVDEFVVDDLEMLDLGLAAPVLRLTVDAASHGPDATCSEALRLDTTAIYALLDGHATWLFEEATLEEQRYEGPAECPAGYGIARTIDLVERPGAPAQIRVTVVRSDDPAAPVGLREVYAPDGDGRYHLLESNAPPDP